jgi:hypothetical protein
MIKYRCSCLTRPVISMSKIITNSQLGSTWSRAIKNIPTCLSCLHLIWLLQWIVCWLLQKRTGICVALLCLISYGVLTFVVNFIVWKWLIDWCLMPTLSIFQLYRGVNDKSLYTSTYWYMNGIISMQEFVWQREHSCNIIRIICRNYAVREVSVYVNLIHWSNKGPSCSWSYSSWIYNYLCNQCLSPLTLWVGIPLRRGVLDTT